MHRCSAMKKNNNLLLFLVYLLFYFVLPCLFLACQCPISILLAYVSRCAGAQMNWPQRNIIALILNQHEMHVACTSHAIFIPIYALHNYVMFGRQNDKIHRRMSLSKHIIKICHNRRQLIITLQCVIFEMHLPFLICE